MHNAKELSDLQIFRFLMFGDTLNPETSEAGTRQDRGDAEFGLLLEDTEKQLTAVAEYFHGEADAARPSSSQQDGRRAHKGGKASTNDPRPFIDLLNPEFYEQLPPFEETAKDATALLAETDEYPALLERVRELFLTRSDSIFEIFKSRRFATRRYYNPAQIIAEFIDFREGRGHTNLVSLLRILYLELFQRDFKAVSPADDSVEPSEKDEERVAPPKTDFEPNAGKNLDIEVDGVVYRRYAIFTQKVTKDVELDSFVSERIARFISDTKSAPGEDEWWQKPWYFFISETVVSVMEGRSHFIWDIHPGWWARTLSNRVVKTPHGIGLGSPWTMQLAIDEAGLPKILFAAVCSVIGKVFGKSGVFYNVAGPAVRAIDGPAAYCVYPLNISAKLPPRDSKTVAKGLRSLLKRSLSKEQLKNFGGVVVIDANDIGQNVLGQDADISADVTARIFKDNPLGQGDEQTPISVVAQRN